MPETQFLASKAVIFDLETGGLIPGKHPIIQFAGAAVDRDFNVFDELEVKLCFDVAQCDPIALTKNGYKDNGEARWAKEAVGEREALQRIAGFFGKHATYFSFENGKQKLVAANMGHNATAFDKPFIDIAADRHGIFVPKDKLTICTMQYALWFFRHRPAVKPPRYLSLKYITEYFGVDFGGEGAHDALEDVRALAKVMKCFKAGGKKYAEVLAAEQAKVKQQPLFAGASK